MTDNKISEEILAPFKRQEDIEKFKKLYDAVDTEDRVLLMKAIEYLTLFFTLPHDETRHNKIELEILQSPKKSKDNTQEDT